MHNTETEQIDTQDDFDVGKWRTENPPDYFKAMSLLLQSDGSDTSDTIFDAVFRIFRMYIPEKLYKYQSLGLDSKTDALRFETLNNKQIFTASLRDLNDPYDSCSYFFRVEKIGQELDIDEDAVNKAFEVLRMIRIAALTAVGEQSMPMWAHYANNHRGFCVEYDTTNKENETLREFLFPVQYSERRIDLTSFLLEKTQHEITLAKLGFNGGAPQICIHDKSLIYIPILLANIKHPSWSYEKEFRCIIPDSSPIAPYIDAAPSALYAGMNCSNSDLAVLGEICTELDIPLYHLRANPYDPDYALARKKLMPMQISQTMQACTAPRRAPA